MMIALCLMLLVPGEHATFDALWSAANAAYQDGDFEAARQKYEAILNAGIEDGALHYNLGNTYFREKKLGKALVHFYKAQQLLPGDQDVLANIQLANEARIDPIMDEEKENFGQSIDRTLRQVNYNLVFGLAALFLTLGGLATLLLILKPSVGKWAGYVLVIGFVFGLILTGFTFIQHKHLTRRDFAVVIEHEVNVLSGPNTTESINFTIHEGIRCQVMDQVHGWSRVRLANGYNGWLPSTAIERI